GRAHAPTPATGGARCQSPPRGRTARSAPRACAVLCGGVGCGARAGKRRVTGGQKEPASLCVAQATLQWLFTGAIPLLTGTGVLTCSVSDLGRFTPP
uniref:Uncharacterized protein n=1 Tax=Gallus gallus TaxID=9031 RepID=A0A8V0ZDD3_CHICK